MKNNQVFVDTSMFFALVNDKDQFHKSAVSIWEKLKNTNTVLITSNYILNETFALIRSRRGVKIVDDFRKSLTNQYEIKIIRITVTDEANAWEYFLKDWSNLSFTDSVSFAVMARLGLKQVATFDKDFRRAGFQIFSCKLS